MFDDVLHIPARGGLHFVLQFIVRAPQMLHSGYKLKQLSLVIYRWPILPIGVNKRAKMADNIPTFNFILPVFPHALYAKYSIHWHVKCVQNLNLTSNLYIIHLQVYIYNDVYMCRYPPNYGVSSVCCVHVSIVVCLSA